MSQSQSSSTHEYDKLVNHLKVVYDYRWIRSVLEWDQQVYMPPKGNEARARQVALLAELAHQKMIDPQYGEWLEKANSHLNFSEDQKALLREAKRDRDRAIRVPAKLVQQIAEHSSKAHPVWAECRKKNDFKGYIPTLQRMLELKIEEAHALGFASGGVPYDAHLETFEPGATVQTLNPVLAQTREIVVAALQAIQRSKKKPKKGIFNKVFPIGDQKKFGEMVAAKIGYDFQAGRLDVSAHPFTTSFDIQDVRITTRYSEKNLIDSIFSTIHEAGHGIYEQNLPLQHCGTPLGEYLTMGIHESQSRFWENCVGRSRAFWKYFYPKLVQQFPQALKKVKFDDFYIAMNEVKPSFIRVDADEVTYNLHIVLRYEIEKGLFSGEYKVEDLPAVWNQKMKDYLGIVPKKDSLGVLQDVHWSFGGFGYFPSYLLGNLYAAQWLAVMKKEMKDFEKQILKGDFSKIRQWLKEKIHQHGRRYTASELVKRISGESLNPVYFENYLKTKFGELYNVQW